MNFKQLINSIFFHTSHLSPIEYFKRALKMQLVTKQNLTGQNKIELHKSCTKLSLTPKFQLTGVFSSKVNLKFEYLC